MSDIVKQLIVLDDGQPRLQCPVIEHDGPCDGAPHMRVVEFGRGVPVTSTSGPGLIVNFYCERGHMWDLCLEDHSAGIWLGCSIRGEASKGL